MNLIQHYINGKIVSGESSRKGKVFNPATGAQESEVILGMKSDLDKAVEHAKKAFFTWSAKPPIQLSLIHISEPTRRTPISYAVFCLNPQK